jgi:hypothetical protein
MESDKIKTKLNDHLQTHPNYETWMVFDSVEIKEGGIIVPRFRSPESAGVTMPSSKAREIYGQVCADIIP